MSGQETTTHDQRKQRLSRLADLIQRRLDQEMAKMAQAQTAYAQSLTTLESEIARHRVAKQASLAKLAAGAEASQWQLEHAWQEMLLTSVQTARARVDRCTHELSEARTRVLVAHEDLQRMNALLKRVDTSRRIELARKERKAEDDTYAALASVGLKCDAS